MIFDETFEGGAARGRFEVAKVRGRKSPEPACAAMEGAAQKRCSRTAAARARSIAFSAISSEYDAQPICITSSERWTSAEKTGHMQTAKDKAMAPMSGKPSGQLQHRAGRHAGGGAAHRSPAAYRDEGVAVTRTRRCSTSDSSWRSCAGRSSKRPSLQIDGKTEHASMLVYVRLTRRRNSCNVGILIGVRIFTKDARRSMEERAARVPLKRSPQLENSTIRAFDRKVGRVPIQVIYVGPSSLRRDYAL
jgi:hypothetical protein